MADLDDVASGFRARHGRRFRVATKYLNLTRRFFAEKGVLDYRIVESLGATEGAPAAGTAEAIVDITTTGGTLAANALKVLDDGEILASEANLVASRRAAWGEPARTALRTLLDRMSAEARAARIREVRFQSAALDRLAREAADVFGAVPPFGSAGEKGVLHVERGRVFALVDWLRANGAGAVTVARLDYVFEPDNALWERVAARL